MTTRDELNTYTSERALGERRASDGGFYIPYRLPKLSLEELRDLREMAPGDCIHFIVRRFLRISESVLDPGSIPVRCIPCGNRVVICETFPKWSGSFSGYMNEIAKITRLGCFERSPWLDISFRIGAIAAALFKYPGSYLGVEEGCIDIAIVSGDLFGPVSVYLAREMGLPVGDILCCCNENSGFWELLHHGEIRTDQIAVCTGFPEADVAVPDGLECLLALCCGRDEVDRYLRSLRAGRPYRPGEEASERLRSLFRATVVTAPGHICGAYIAHGIPVKPATALTLAGLLNLRATKGAYRPALVISE